jgi:hypothetical protein
MRQMIHSQVGEHGEYRSSDRAPGRDAEQAFGRFVPAEDSAVDGKADDGDRRQVSANRSPRLRVITAQRSVVSRVWAMGEGHLEAPQVRRA